MPRSPTPILACLALVIAFLVTPLWHLAGTPPAGLRRVPASRALTAAFLDALCRPAYDGETLQWDPRPFEGSALKAALGATAEARRVREIRTIYRDLLRREPAGADCASVRDWVDRGLGLDDVERQLAASPEGRRVARVRQIFVATFGRDPRSWDDGALRRWVDSPFTLTEITTRLVAQRPLVGIHYFTWYRPDGGLWRNALTSVPTAAPTPTLGRYDSSDPDVIEAHVGQMAGLGLDLVIVHVVAQMPGSWANAHVLFDRLPGRRTKAALMLDGLYAETAAVKAMWVRKANAEFAFRPEYFSFHGEPLVLLFSAPLDFTVSGVALRNVYWNDRYDPGRNTFNPDLQLYRGDWPFWAASPQPLVNGLVPVVAGYDDSDLGRPQTMAYPRRNGDLYREQWRRALALHPELIVIYSWNEYFERTAIEPTAAWGSQYLQLTACYIAHAHRGTTGAC